MSKPHECCRYGTHAKVEERRVNVRTGDVWFIRSAWPLVKAFLRCLDSHTALAQGTNDNMFLAF